MKPKWGSAGRERTVLLRKRKRGVRPKGGKNAVAPPTANELTRRKKIK